MRLACLLVIGCLAAACGGDDDGGSDGSDGDTPDGAPGTGDAGEEPDAGAGSATVHLSTYFGWEHHSLPFVAVQDGDGDWQRILHDSEGEYSFEAPSGRYGIAYLCEGGTGRYLWFFYATRDEYPAVSRGCDASELGPGGGVLFTITGLDTDAVASVSVDTGVLNLTMAGDTAGILSLAPGPHDLYVGARPNGVTLTRCGVKRDIPVTDGNNTSVTFDAVSDTSAGTARTITVNGATADEMVFREARLLTKNGTRGKLNNNAAATVFLGCPVAALAPVEVHRISATAEDSLTTRIARRMFHAPMDAALTLPPFFLPDGLGLDQSGDYPRATAQFGTVAGVEMYRAQWLQGGEVRQVYFTATRGWVGDAPSVNWEQPDLSNADGWDNAWALADSGTVTWTASAIDSDTVDPLRELETFPSTSNLTPEASWDGATVTMSSRTGLFLP